MTLQILLRPLLPLLERGAVVWILNVAHELKYQRLGPKPTELPEGGGTFY